MNQKQISEIKTQTWNHLQELRGKIADLQAKRFALTRRQFYDTHGVKRDGCWIIDQLIFTQSEAEFWKSVAPSE